MIKFNILTIFPEVFSEYFKASIIGRAVEKGLLEINVINIRDYSQDKHKKTDDEPFGGGAGMVMLADPIFRAIESLNLSEQAKVILTTPQGRLFNQSAAKELAKTKEICIICGRYEGVDERVAQELVTDEFSIGDYVLTGGELPAMVMVDAIARMVEGVVGKTESVINDSFYATNAFDGPHYTRPAEYRGLKVPEVLLGGNHKEINNWRQAKAQEKLKQNRPELG